MSSSTCCICYTVTRIIVLKRTAHHAIPLFEISLSRQEESKPQRKAYEILLNLISTGLIFRIPLLCYGHTRLPVVSLIHYIVSALFSALARVVPCAWNVTSPPWFGYLFFLIQLKCTSSVKLPSSGCWEPLSCPSVATCCHLRPELSWPTPIILCLLEGGNCNLFISHPRPWWAPTHPSIPCSSVMPSAASGEY